MFKISNYALTMAFLADGATRSHATCSGVVASFTGECSYANFIGSLSTDCSITELFPPTDDGTSPAEAEIATLCAYDAPVQFVEIQGTYQQDRRYFAGAGPLVDGENTRIAAAKIARFEANLAHETLIAFPEYVARVQYNINTFGEDVGTNGYPANMNLAASCDLNTVMCCFAEGDFAEQGDATTDVCHHDLRNSPESNHVARGWSAFPGSEAPAHCVGFTWKDGEDELLGNMMYDVSLRNSINKGYLQNIPGAPMCGCVEHMPVVAQASCRTATKTEGITYQFSYAAETDENEGYLSASNSVGIEYGDCDEADLRAQYIANQEGDAAKASLIDAHIASSGACDEQFLGSHFTVAGQIDRYTVPDTDLWSDLVFGGGIHFLPPDIDPTVADGNFRDLIDGGCTETDANGNTSSRYCIVRRTCASCFDSHQDIYYQRTSALPTDDIYFHNVFLGEWRNEQNNMAAGDFALYSTYEDARAGANAWTHCNYNKDKLGFPRDCGPTGYVGGNWNSNKHNSHALHYGYYVEKP